MSGTHLCCLLFSLSPLLLPLSPCCITVCMEWALCSSMLWPPHAQCTQKALVSACSHYDINHMTQIRHIEYRSAAVLSARIVQITANMPMSDINIGLTLISKETVNTKPHGTYKRMEHFANLLVCRPVADAWLQFSDKELVCHMQFRNAMKDDVNVGQL